MEPKTWWSGNCACPACSRPFWLALASAAGAAFQSLLRSPLADPYLMGTSAGASLGTALAVVLGLAYGLYPVCAFAGARAVLFVTRLARIQQGAIRN